jgi:hypothetical protein
MFRQYSPRAVPWIFALLLITSALPALADEINYNFYGVPPSPFSYGFGPIDQSGLPQYGQIYAPPNDMPMPQYLMPGDGISQPTDSGWLWTVPLEQQSYDPWQEREARDFHPGYATWDDYYASPPWKNQDEHDFNPWWMR